MAVVDPRLTAARPRGDLTDNQPPVAVLPHARTLPHPMPTHLFASDLAHGAVDARTARRWLADWRDLGWPRVERVQRRDAHGAPVGGVQWGVRSDDYDDLIHGRVRESVGPVEAQAA